MEKLKHFLRRLIRLFGAVDVILSWYARLPAAVRTTVVAFLLAVGATLFAVIIDAAVWLNGFVRDLWSLALLTVLAGAAIGTQLNGAVKGIVSALDRVAASQGGRNAVVVPITDKERWLIQQFRVLWNRHAREPVGSMKRLLYGAQQHLQVSGAYWPSLLRPAIDDLIAKSAAMEEAAGDREVRPDAIQKAFEEAFGAYYAACRWVAKIKHYEQKIEWHHDWVGDLDTWRGEHRQLRSAIDDFHEDPDLKGKLQTFHPRFDQDIVFIRFIRDAEGRPMAAEAADSVRQPDEQ